MASRWISRRGQEHDEEWLASGWSVDLPCDKETLQAIVWLRILPMPISLELQNFEVERNEGNDSPAGIQEHDPGARRGGQRGSGLVLDE